MIDKPLYGNPLAGGGGTLDRLSNKVRGGLSFRQEGDMGRYVADNDPGGIAAGYSNLKDYLAAGNKLPEFANPEPLKGFENPALASSIIGNGIYDMDTSGMLLPGAPGTSTLNVTPPSVPVSEQTPIPGIIDNFRPKSDDPLVQGYMDSDFYERASTTNVVPYTYQGKEMSGSGSYASNFKKYLDSIGKGDLIQFPNQEIAQQGSGPLATIGGPTPPPGFGTPMDPIGVGQDVTGNNPIETPVPSNPFTGFQNQLTGFNDQFSSMGDRLTKLEEGIASLLNQNGEFGFNSMQPKFGAPNYGYSPFSMTGLGSLFGGYYG